MYTTNQCDNDELSDGVMPARLMGDCLSRTVHFTGILTLLLGIIQDLAG